MTKNDLILKIYNSPTINATLDKVSPEYRDDFRSHFYLQIVEVPEQKLIEANNRCETCLEQFAGAILKLQLKSNNSSFHYQYRKDRNVSYDWADKKIEVAYASDDSYSIKYLIQRYNEMLPTVNPTELTAEQIQKIHDTNYNNIINYLNHLHPKKSLLFIEHHINGKTLKQISEQYGIKYRTIHHSIRLTEQLIRDNVKFEL